MHRCLCLAWALKIVRDEFVLLCSWIESDRDESEDVNKIERAFDDATDGLRDVLSKG